MTTDPDDKFTPTQRLALEAIDKDAQRNELLDSAIHTASYDTRTHVAVPREPTEAMIEAGWDDVFNLESVVQRGMAIDNYTAMLRASEGEE